MDILKSLFSRIDLLKAFQNFPLSSSFAVVATLAAIFYIDFNDNETLMRIAAAGYLGFLSSIVVEVHLKNKDQKWLYIFPFLVFGLWYFYIPFNVDDLPEHQQMRRAVRFMASALILHLMISVVPYIMPSEEEDFWEYNKHLFLRIFESALFSLIIFLGLAMAIVALDHLFELDVDGEWYGRLFIFLAGIFNSLYFLSKFPKLDYDGQVEPPFSGYKVFSEYILIGITMIYLVLLYAYAGKIISQSELPKGWIGYLTNFFSVIGILTWLLNYFNPKFSSHKSTHFFIQHFFKFLTIPVIMLFVAIYVRISDYGITEPRYIVAALALWLSVLVIAYGWLNKPHIKYIPISLAVLVGISAFSGPLDMFNVSLRNQSERLKSALVDNNILVDRRLDLDALKSFDNDLKFQIKEGINAIGDRSEYDHLDSWTDDELFEGIEEKETKRSFLYDKFHVFDAVNKRSSEIQRFYISRRENDYFDISNFNKMQRSDYYKSENGEQLIHISNDSILIDSFPPLPITTVVKRYHLSSEQVATEEMEYDINNGSDSIRLLIETISGYIEEGEVKLDHINCWILKN